MAELIVDLDLDCPYCGSGVTVLDDPPGAQCDSLACMASWDEKGKAALLPRPVVS